MIKIVFATNNQHKLRELQQILGNKFELLGLTDINCFEEIPETSPTIEENSMEKANYVRDKYKADCFADDTGLEIEALDGRPGVYSARYAGEEKNMDKNIEKVLSELENMPNRNARFKTVISLIINGKKHQFEGVVSGKIIKIKKGVGGFGYDPVFMPNGYDITFAEMDAELKRRDFCVEYWESQNPKVYCYWKTKLPEPNQKKQLFVDDQMLMTFFERLEQETQQEKINFRFVLALILMRKRRLKYDSSEIKDGMDIWRLRVVGDNEFAEVTNPHLDEEQIEQLSSQLSQILQTEL